MHVDHVEAFVRGGTNELDNLRAVHPECNLRKADRPSNWKTPIAQLPPQSAEKRQAVNSDIKQTGYSADEKRAVLVALDKANEKLVMWKLADSSGIEQRRMEHILPILVSEGLVEQWQDPDAVRFSRKAGAPGGTGCLSASD